MLKRSVTVLLIACTIPSCAAAPERNRREALDRVERDLRIHQMLQERPKRPADAEFLAELGRAMWTQGRLAEAESAYHDLLRISHSPEYASGLLQIQLLRGHYRDAALTARVSIEKHGAAVQPAWLTEMWPQLQWFTPSLSTAVDFVKSEPETPRDLFGAAMVLVPGGGFVRGVQDGEPDARPAKTITVSPFWIGLYEVTASQFKRFVSESSYPYRVQYPEPTDSSQGERAMVGVSWIDARAFTMWLSARGTDVYRLPTEAEWEFSARGGGSVREPWGRERGQAQVTGNWGLISPSELRAPIPPVRRVGSFLLDRSPFGLMDVAGNASEWCLDEYDSSYYAWAQDRDPVGPVETRGVKVLRGGSWNSPWTTDFAIRRGHSGMNVPYTGFGFRIVREVRASTRRDQ